MELCSMLCCSLHVLWVQNGFMYVCDLVALLFTGNYPNIVNSLYPNTKFKSLIYIYIYFFKPQYLRMFFYLEIGYLQSNQIKMSSLVWILILYCLCLHKKGKFSHWFDWRGQREEHLKTPGDFCLQAKGCLRPPESEEDISSRFYPTALPQKESTLPTP